MAKSKYGISAHSWAKHMKEWKKFFWRRLRNKTKQEIRKLKRKWN